MTRTVLVAAALALLAGCGGGDGGEAKPGTTPATPTTSKAPATVSATALITALDALAIADGSGSNCENLTGELATVRTGANIDLKNKDGEVVATATLGDPPQEPPATVCAWSAVFNDVPAGEGPYVAEISGRSSKPVEESKLTTDVLMVELN